MQQLMYWNNSLKSFLKFFIFHIICLLFVSNNLLAQESNCSDGIDNDNNGLIDCFDPHCSCYTCDNGQDNLWHLTNGWRMDFNNGTVQGTNTGIPLTTNSFTNTLEGHATVADPNGNLLFFTNGCYVWDRNNNRMNDATTGNIAELDGGLSATNAAVVVPHPSNPLQYYIFTAGDALGALGGALIDGVDYSIVDFNSTSNNGLGEVTTIDVPLIPKEMSTEKFAVARKANCRDYWVITHDYEDFSGTNTNTLPGQTYMVYEVVANSGLNTIPAQYPQSSGVFHHQTTGGSIPSVNRRHKQGQLVLSSDQSLIANAVSGTSFVEIGLFDNATGQVFILSTLTIPNNEEAWGVSFSPSSQHLYVTTTNNSLYRYNVAAGTILNLNYPSSNTIGYLQLGPDGNLYVAEYGGYILQIVDPDGTPSLVSTGIPSSGHALSYVIPDYCTPSIDVTIDPNTACENSTVDITATATNGAIKTTLPYYDYTWNTGNINQSYTSTPPTTSTATITEQLPSGFNPTYQTTMTDYYGCTATASEVANTLPAPTVNLVASNNNICPGQSIELIASVPDSGSYVWEEVGNGIIGGNTNTITVAPTTNTTYNVIFTNTAGCSDTASITITINTPIDFPVVYNTPTGRDQCPDICTDLNNNLYTAFSYRGNATVHNNTFAPNCPHSASVITKYNDCDAVEWVYPLPSCLKTSLAGVSTNGSPDIMDVDASNNYLYILADAHNLTTTITFGSSTITNNGMYILQLENPQNTTAPIPVAAQFVANDNVIGLTVDNNGDILILSSQKNSFTTSHIVQKYAGNTFPSSPLWTSTIQTYSNNLGASSLPRNIITDLNNDVVIIGNMYQPNGQQDIYVSKLEASSGNLLWNTFFGNGTNANNEGFDLTIDNNNDIIIAGKANMPITFGGTTLVTGDGYLTKLDEGSGAPIWANSFINTFTVGVAVDLQDNIFLSRTDNASNTATLSRFSPSGTLDWDLPYNNAPIGYVTMNDLTLKPDNNFIYASNFLRGSATMNGITVSALGSSPDIMISRIEDLQSSGVYARPNATTNSTVTSYSKQQSVEILTNTETFEADRLQVNLYPNPTNGLFTLDITGTHSTAIKSVTLLDIRGQLLKEIQVDHSRPIQYSFDMGHYSNGVYLVKVLTKNETITKRITVIK